MEKQQIIHNKWSDLGIILLISQYDFDGWIDANELEKGQITTDLEYKKYRENEFDHETMLCRPKSLKGIESNNGWIKIESKNDLPNGNYALYHVISKNNNYCNEPKNQGIEEFWGNDIEKRQYWLKEFTHYQPIIKPDLPIY